MKALFIAAPTFGLIISVGLFWLVMKYSPATHTIDPTSLVALVYAAGFAAVLVTELRKPER